MKSISINLIICMSCVLLSLQSRMKTREENDSQKSLFEALSSEYSKDKNQYVDELNKIGFYLEKFIEMNVSNAIPYSASIYVRKGK